MPGSDSKISKDGRGEGSSGGAPSDGRKLRGASSIGDSDAKKDNAAVTRRKLDGTVNKMSFDVDDLEEGQYFQVEEDEDVEEIVEYEDTAEGEVVVQNDSGRKEFKESEKFLTESKQLPPPTPEESVGYKIRPDLSHKFRPGTVQAIVERAIKDKLEGKEYSAEYSDGWVKQILEDVHDKVKNQNYRRYKVITHITLGERRGEGASSATRCLWDAEADCMATYTFLNDSIFCNGTVYGIYFY